MKFAQFKAGGAGDFVFVNPEMVELVREAVATEEVLQLALSYNQEKQSTCKKACWT